MEFEFAVPPQQAWDAFVNTDEPAVWNRPFRTDAPYITGRGHVEVDDLVPGQPIHFTEVAGDHRVEMTVSFVETESGTRITITRSGFGEGDAWAAGQTAVLLGWRHAMHDYAVYLLTGRIFQRLHDVRSSLGIADAEVPGGVRVLAVRPGMFAEQAGLQPGDLIVRITGAPVFERSDLWLVQRMLKPGTEVEVEYVRDGELASARGALSPSDWRGSRRRAAAE